MSFFLAEFSANSNGLPEKLPLTLKLPSSLKKHEKLSISFYLRAHTLVENIIDVNISYTLDQDKPVISMKTQSIIVPVVKPFDITTKFLSSLMEDVSQFYVGEQIGIMPTLRCLSPWPIIIENTSIEFVRSQFVNRFGFDSKI